MCIGTETQLAVHVVGSYDGTVRVTCDVDVDAQARPPTDGETITLKR